MQFLLLIRSPSRKTLNDTVGSSSARKSTDLYAICAQLLGEQLREKVDVYERNDIFVHMDSIFREL